MTLVGHAEALTAPKVSPTTLPARTLELKVGLGLVGTGDGIGWGMATRPAVQPGLAWGITDRLQLGLLHLSYRFGDRGSVEFVPTLALGDVIDLEAMSGTGISLSSTMAEGTFLLLAPALRLGLRVWFADVWTLNVTAEGAMGLQIPRAAGELASWSAGAALGFTRFLGDHAAASFGVRYGYSEVRGPSGEKVNEVSLGSVQSIGGRVLPLVAVQVTRSVSVETQMVVVMRERKVDARELRIIEGVAVLW
ncbi:MAG: hypothetical protein QM765_26505 [Myxococcales bacterium]